jgi:hypothetical protein
MTLAQVRTAALFSRPPLVVAPAGIVVRPLASASAAADNVTTTSFLPTANSKLFVCASAYRSGTSLAAFTFVLGGGLTLTIINQQQNTTGTPRTRSGLWATDVGASPVSMTVQATSTAATETSLSVFEITSILTDVSNTNADRNTAGGGVTTNLITAPAGTSFHVSSFCGGHATAAVAPTAPSGFTNIIHNIPVTNHYVRTAYQSSSPTQDAAWTSSNSVCVVASVEAKAA